MKVRTSDDGNFGRRARFRRATREDGDGGRATREDDDGRGRASRGETLWGRPDRARGARASVARARARERCGDARAVSIGSNETFRWIRAMRGRGRWRARDEDGDDG